MKAISELPSSSIPDVFEVLDGCHRDIRAHLDTLVAVVAQLQTGGTPRESVRTRARELITFFTGPAREHNYDEELYIFPALVRCNDLELKRTAEGLCEDHAWIELCWLDIEPGLAAAADGLSSYDLPALRSAANAFVTVMAQHMMLEESLLYPQLRGRFEATVLESIGREMAARRASSPVA